MKTIPLALALALAVAPALAQAPQPPQAASFDWVQRADGARLVPERFLQPWDPITLFFDRDIGPARGGPEDNPERIVAMRPEQAGAWQWLGPRTLQFRPAEPWRPLRRVEVTADGHKTKLVPLLPAPVKTAPESRPEGIADLDQIALTFAEPVDAAALARLLTIELRPLPGLSERGGQVLAAGDFTTKALERAQRSDQQTYLVTLRQPVPDGRLVKLRLKLSDEPGLDDPTFELSLRTAVPFQVTDLTCGRRLQRKVEDGVLRCTPVPLVTYDEEGNEEKKYQPGARRTLAVAFSGEPEAIDVVRAREALRITPPVDDLAVEKDGTRLRLSGRFQADVAYELRIAPGALKDARGRALEGLAFTQRFAFERDKPSLAWDANQGIVERFGPQMIPLRGRGYERADVRIHAIDPLSRDFWPFPADGLETDDAAAPPLPGNEPKRWAENEEIGAEDLAARIKVLGTPAVSELVSLPIQRGGVEAKFGLDLKPLFAKAAGAEQAGAYLVGLRPLDGGKRRWIRVQVTDLTLSAVEEPERVRFAVNSLHTTAPVAGAEIRLEGLREDKFVTLARGVTDPGGFFTWDLAKRGEAEIRRIVVAKGTDVLVVEPDRGPSQYSDENWSKPEEPWLAWAGNPEEKRAEEARILCHVFTERPIYRPEEPVHVKGYVRRYLGGALSYATTGGTLVVQGPSDQEWRFPVRLDRVGGFYHKFDAETPATGDYTVRFEPDGEGEACGEFPFKKEAYRLPTFEVLLNGPQRVPLDGEFSVDLLARYFAGGLVAERPVKWRVTQFPHHWTPPGREGFLFSTDARYSGEGRFRSTPVLERETRTDAGGSGRITLDPTIEPTAQPRRYAIEATVTGDDDIQVRSTQSVVALPPFVLGVKIPRYLPDAATIEPEVIALDAAGEPLTGLEMTVRLIKRNWTSVLQASDFSQGSAKYVTEVIDETLVERKVTSAREAERLVFEAKGAGVYLVQLEASDRIGRRQSVSVDFFVSGGTPVTWSRPPTQTVQVSSDKDAYAPGETATLVVQSPFQTARALAIVEEPDGRYRYDWVEITNGFGRYEVAIRKEAMPKLPVHFLVMRGRLPNAAANPTAPFDQGKPVTVAATKWVTVTPVKHIVTASLEYPQRARPAQEIEVTLRLADDAGRPVSGEAVFWMVDQAVLSIAREQPLDPLPKFIVSRPTQMALRDTRNMAFGVIPLEETPGGDDTGDDWGIENISVRKNFTPVPIYLPRVAVGQDGVARIKVKLPDTLTVFKLRAKAISGPDRFGYATGELMVRQEIVAQPALPRFVRPGDRFEAGLIGRIVEGAGGTGRAALSVEGATQEGANEQRLSWQQNRPARVDFPLAVGEPKPGDETLRLRFVLQRDADKAGDAVQIDLPVRPDRSPIRQRQIVDLRPGASLTLPAPASARPGSYARSVTFATDPAVVRLVGGLNYLVEYPYGCTEQRIALAHSAVAVKAFAPLLAAAGLTDRLSADVRATQRAIEQSIDEDGLVAFWPRARGNVSLTAWAYSFLVVAEKAGETVDKALAERLAKVLKQALRSDYQRLIAGEELRERVEALKALAEGGQLEESYVAELARRAAGLPNASLGQATAAVAQLPTEDRRLVASLLDELWGRVKLLSRDGRLSYAGLAGEGGGNPVILPSEVRSLAEITRAVTTATPDEPRLAVLRDGLIRLGEGDGWGSTNANAAAIRALAAAWQRPSAAVPLTLAQGGAPERLALDGEATLLRRVSHTPSPTAMENKGASPVVALVDTRFQPAEPGSRAEPVSNGFVVTRQSFRVPGGAPPERLTPDADGAIRVTLGDVVEEAAELVNPEDRTHVAIRLPLAAGMEPLNPNLATAPAEATPSAGPTLPPTWVSFQDDHVLYAYERLPKGNYRFAFRTRAQVAGSFTQPPGEAEMMYRPGVYGASAGTRLVVAR